MTNLEINIKVAELLGHKVIKTVWGKQKQCFSYSLGKSDYYDEQGLMVLSNPLPNYAENISEAFEALNRLQTECSEVIIKQDYDGVWSCRLTHLDTTQFSYGSTASQAICMALVMPKVPKNE